MKRIWILIVVMAFAFSSPIFCESLSELAKKEKARREKIEKEGKKGKVYTNQDIKNIKSSLGIETVSGPAVDTSQPEPGAEEPQTSAATEPLNQETQEQIQALKEERELLVEEIAEARGNLDAGGGVHTANVGEQFQRIRTAEKRIKEIDSELQKLEKKESE